MGAWCISSEVQVQGNKLYKVKVFDNTAYKKIKWERKQKGVSKSPYTELQP